MLSRFAAIPARLLRAVPILRRARAASVSQRDREHLVGKRDRIERDWIESVSLIRLI